MRGGSKMAKFCPRSSCWMARPLSLVLIRIVSRSREFGESYSTVEIFWQELPAKAGKLVNPTLVEIFWIPSTGREVFDSDEPLHVFFDNSQQKRPKILMYNFLYCRQQVDYGIFIVEQDGAGAFNRAMLLNVGAAEALKSYDFQCFIFHDVDLLPEDDRNLYTCPVQPRHMSVAINKYVNRHSKIW